MLDYFIGLSPHKVHETISINDMREKILDLTRPLADIAKTIDITIKVLDDKKEEIEQSQGTVEQIKKEINIMVCIKL